MSQVLEALKKKNLSEPIFGVLSLDSTFVKSSPSAAGALKKRAASDRSDDQDLCDRRGADDAGRAKTLGWECWRRPVGREFLRNIDVKRLKPRNCLNGSRLRGRQTRRTARNVGLKPVVPPKRNRRNPWRYNKKLYKRRNEVDRFLRRIKDFRRIAMRCDTPDIMFLAF